jgi:tetratricopeptide (TPR) repeat protein
VAQSASDVEALFNNKQYARAKVMYESLLKRKPNDAMSNYRYARCNYELKNYEAAIQHFELAGSRYPLKDLYLGELYFITYQFDLSVAAYQNYLTSLEPDDKKIVEIEQLIKKSELGAKLLNRVESVVVIDSSIVSKSDFLRYYNLNAELGSLSQQRVRLNSKSTHDKISFTTQRGDRQYLSDSVKGNMNILTSYKLLDEWSPAVSASPVINTKSNENYPFLLLDGISLFYASDGENSLGGYDIFLTKYSSSTKDFLSPDNVGFPFNSPANDYMMAIDELHKTGWFATDRNQTTGKLAVYKFEYNDPKVYYKTEDSVMLRKVAQLKSYKTSKKSRTTSTNATKIETEFFKSEKLIVINDSIVYNSPDQFQQTKAMQLYNETTLMTNELQKLQETLATARNDFDNASSIAEKLKLAEQIRILEPTIYKLTKEITNKKKEAINKEINFLFNK